MNRILTIIPALALTALTSAAQKVEMLRYGDFDTWVVRNIKESALLGGDEKTVYEIGPDAVIDGDKAYTPMGGSPWATSNVLAKPMGITKTSNAVYPDKRAGHGRCAKLTTQMEHCTAIGIIDLDVMVAGSIFLGRMIEPIKSTKNPYSKMEMGIPFTKRPKAMRFDYRMLIPAGVERVYSSGFGKKRTLGGRDQAEVFILLQRRVEDSKGNIKAYRVGTGRELYGRSTSGWVNGHKVPLYYGDITGKPFYKPYMGLIPAEKSYYARNSKGKMVPVTEVGWDDADAVPTHIIVMFSAGNGEPYVGTPGQTLWVDNVALVY